nr:hypothetical protein CFP56_15207 [Quercus suber]
MENGQGPLSQLGCVSISLDNVTQTPTRSVESEGIYKLFEDNPTPDAQGDGGAATQDGQAKSVGDENHPVEEAKPAEKVVDKEAPIDQP